MDYDAAYERLIEIDEQLVEESYYLRRRDCTPRVMQRSDALLDERNILEAIVTAFESRFAECVDAVIGSDVEIKGATDGLR